MTVVKDRTLQCCARHVQFKMDFPCYVLALELCTWQTVKTPHIEWKSVTKLPHIYWLFVSNWTFCSSNIDFVPEWFTFHVGNAQVCYLFTLFKTIHSVQFIPVSSGESNISIVSIKRVKLFCEIDDLCGGSPGANIMNRSNFTGLQNRSNMWTSLQKMYMCV